MYVRLNTIFGDRDKTAAVLDYIESRDRPVVEAVAGNGGLVTLVDGDSGVVVAASYWDEPMHSSEAVLTQVRRNAELLAGGTVTAEQYEVTAVAWRSRPQRGASVRMSGAQLESARLEDAVLFLGGVLLPELARSEKLCTAQIFVDTGSSAAIVFTIWENAQLAEDVSPVVVALRDQPVDHGVKFVTDVRYSLFGISPGGMRGAGTRRGPSPAPAQRS
jgi:hypothetical protein